MNKTTEALKLAEALENDAKEHREVSYGLDCPPERTANWKHALNCEAAARLIREALAEPVKQEPVALVFVNRHGDVEITDYTLWQLERGHYKIYAAPVRTKDLTDDEILPDGYGVVTTYDGLLEFARAVIAAYKEKNK